MIKSNPEAAAYVDHAVPLRREGDVFVPADGTHFDRLRTQQARIWPILSKDGQMVDTMFAYREDAEAKNWEYFIITRDGSKFKCSK